MYVYLLMANKKEKNAINLIPKSEFESSTLGRILSWLLTTFRYIVIATEMVVMLAFFSRMWLDAKNADLADEIRQKQAVLSATSDFETIFKNNQQKLSLLHDLFAMEGTKSHIFESVVASTPEDIVLSAYSDSDSGIAITGDSPTEMSIAQFLVNLKAIKAVTSVNLTQIKIDQDSSLLSFSISLGAEGK